MINIKQRGSITIIILAILIILITSFSGCLNDPASKDKSGIDNDIIISDDNKYNIIKENKEAELIALYLSGEMIAPDYLYLKVLNDLDKIRNKYNSSEILKFITFLPPWLPRIRIEFNESTFNEVKDGKYSEWDELNNKYNVSVIEKQLLNKYHFIFLHFNYSYNPRLLSKLYEELPGVIYAQQASSGPSAHHLNNIYPRKKGKDINYLFCKGCSDGCSEIYVEYWYFVFKNNQPNLVGKWNSKEDPKEPDWLNKAKINIAEFELEMLS